MTFGCCVAPQEEARMRLLARLGYAFVELPFTALASCTREEVERAAALLAELQLPCVSLNILLPGDWKIIGPDADHGRVQRYLEDTLAKITSLHVRTIVVGSGGARRIPEGFPPERAQAQFLSLCTDILLPLARRYDFTVAIEELNQAETNYLNTCTEVMAAVRAVGDPRMRLLVDYYHMGIEQEPLDDLLGCGDAIAHVHIASPRNERAFPRAGDGEDYRAFFETLRRAGYTGTVSLEGTPGPDFEQSARASLHCLTAAAR